MNIPVKIYFVLKFMAYKTKIHKLEYKMKRNRTIICTGSFVCNRIKDSKPPRGPLDVCK